MCNRYTVKYTHTRGYNIKNLFLSFIWVGWVKKKSITTTGGLVCVCVCGHLVSSSRLKNKKPFAWA